VGFKRSSAILATFKMFYPRQSWTVLRLACQDVSPRASDRLKEGGISPEAVEETIGNPDHLDFEDERRRVAQKLMGGKLLRVICEDEKDAIVVISAYSTSKIQKYSR